MWARWLVAIPFVVAALAVAYGLPAGAQEHKAQPAMMDMAKMHEQMMADMTAAESKLNPLVAEMNAAKGDAKVAAMAAVVNELVRQQKAMRERMASMPMMMHKE